MTLSGAETITQESETSQDNKEKKITYTLSNVYDTIRLTGCITVSVNNYQCDYDLSINVTVTDEPENDTSTSLGEKVEVGDILVTYDGASFTPAQGFEGIGITGKPGSDVWSAVLNKLPAAGYSETYGKNVVYKYSVVETTSEDFDLVSVTQSAAAGGTLVATNKLKSGELKVKKAVAGAEPADKTYEIAVRDAEGNYFGTDGTNYGQVPHYETFSANDEKTWAPLTPGKFIVSEKDASVAGYTWTVSGTGDITVVQGETAKTTVTNSYFKDTE